MTATRDDFAAARDLCRRHARSFHFASRFLPAEKRDRAFAVYAFCRLLDDAVDESADESARRAGMARFEAVLAWCYETPDRPPPIDDPRHRAALRAFADTARRCAVPRRWFEDLAEGCRMDLTVARYETWEQLLRYCYHVAGVVGLIMCRVFDLRDERAEGDAVTMGNAMQLTNILRDVGEDWRRGRLYLPRERGYDDLERDIASGAPTPRYRTLMRSLIAENRGMYRAASRGLASLPDDGSRLTACVMSVVYAGILGAIEGNGMDNLTRRAALSWPAKVARLPRAWRLRRGADPAGVF